MRLRARMAPTALGILFAAAVVACCVNGEGLGPVELGARQLVASYAESAFDVALDAEDDGAALQRFLAATEAAAGKADLEQQWSAIAGEVGTPPDFLGRQVFDKATADGDWPGGELDERDVFVGGVRDAVRQFLEGSR